MPFANPENISRAFREPLPRPETQTLWEGQDELTPMEKEAQTILRQCQQDLHGLLAKHRDAVLAREHGFTEAAGPFLNAIRMGAFSCGSWFKPFSADDRDTAAKRFADEIRDMLEYDFKKGWDEYLTDALETPDT